MATNVNNILISKKNSYKIVTDIAYKDETTFLNNVANILKSGVDVIELRFNSLSTAEILPIAKKARDLCAYFNALLILYDRIDIAKLVNADGIMLDSSTVEPVDADKLIENTILIGYYSDKELINTDKINFIVTNNPQIKSSLKVFYI